jgi:mannose-6-phosphate isomerase-like protein (cupin superfamily)
MSGVGTKVVFEDHKIKVWELNLDPGEQTQLHTHKMDYVFYVTSGSILEVFDADNQLIGSFDYRDGDVLPLRLQGDELLVVGNEALRVPATHSARNAGDRPYREILIETK